ncbi:hypothetical protein CWS43_02610 [Rahnella sp. AA]|uniref:right-handed parallel beta-helix repeat-containing protein n=1 Tax=Rahnella sp. AA TaxID=2057180 RepID=UPI000C320282|nr:right-handed parallel beta-helix repeat-containing protein [Rahnella sp. AA]PKE32806.1 hypothetical protein CWS43_02610 [Rahnella sp. AA]
MHRRSFLTLTLLTLGLKGRLSLASEEGKPLNITQHLLDLISSGQSVNIPAGNYVIDAASIQLQSNSRVAFSKDAVFKVNKTGSGEVCIFLIDGKSDIEVSGGVFYYDDDTVDVIKIVNHSADISINEIICQGCRLVVSDVMKSYDLISDGDLNSRINITGCKGSSSIINTRRAFIELHYTKESACEHCIIDGYYHGMMFWGGDSNPQQNGAVGNARKAFQLRFKNNNIKNVQLGGIWGSMGDSVSIESNYLDNGRDVGIDFEGCNNSFAINNEVKDFRHGGLATFFLCNNIRFENNVSISTKKENIVAAIFNSTLKQENKNISFINNNFIGDGVLSSFTQNGSVSELLIKNNKFTNVLITLISPNNGRIEISGNNLGFTILPREGDFIVNVSNSLTTESMLILQENNIHSDKKWFSGEPVFHIKTLEMRNTGVRPLVKDNLIEEKLLPNPAVILKLIQK